MTHVSDVPVLVSVPPDAVNARIVRVVANAVAAHAGLGVDRLDDLALAIDEACGDLLSLDGTAALECAITTARSGVEVRLRGVGADLGGWPIPEWSDTLRGVVLHAVTDDVEELVDGDAPTIRFVLSA